MKNNLSAIILAGGKSTRFDRDKITLKIENKLILELLLSKIHNIFPEIIIVLNWNNFKKFPATLQKKFSQIITVKDEQGIQTPLMGIYTGLLHSSSYYNFVFACDMPQIEVNLIEAMIKKIDNNSDIIIPHYTKDNQEFFEPLFAIYAKNCLKVIEQEIRSGNYQIKKIFNRLKVKYIDEKYLRKFDKKFLSFININTSLDYLRYVKNG